MCKCTCSSTLVSKINMEIISFYNMDCFYSLVAWKKVNLFHLNAHAMQGNLHLKLNGNFFLKFVICTFLLMTICDEITIDQKLAFLFLNVDCLRKSRPSTSPSVTAQWRPLVVTRKQTTFIWPLNSTGRGAYLTLSNFTGIPSRLHSAHQNIRNYLFSHRPCQKTRFSLKPNDCKMIMCCTGGWEKKM